MFCMAGVSLKRDWPTGASAALLLDNVKSGLRLLADVGAGDVESAGCPSFVAVAVGFAVFLEPALAAQSEEGVEFGGVHLAGEVGVAADGDEAAEGLAFFDDDAFGGGVEFEDAVPGVVGGVPVVGFDEGGDGFEGGVWCWGCR